MNNFFLTSCWVDMWFTEWVSDSIAVCTSLSFEFTPAESPTSLLSIFPPWFIELLSDIKWTNFSIKLSQKKRFPFWKKPLHSCLLLLMLVPQRSWLKVVYARYIYNRFTSLAPKIIEWPLMTVIGASATSLNGMDSAVDVCGGRASC